MIDKKCSHHITIGKTDETGDWCVLCGEKVHEEEINRCRLCKHSRKLFSGWICKKNLMTIVPDMHIIYEISKGSCFEKDDN